MCGDERSDALPAHALLIRAPSLALHHLNIADDVTQVAVLEENVFECDRVIKQSFDARETGNAKTAYLDDLAVFTIRSAADHSRPTWRGGVCLSDALAEDFANGEYFAHDLTTFPGLSGAFVMNATNHWVIGIHSGKRGPNHLMAAQRTDGGVCPTLTRIAAADTERERFSRATHVGNSKEALRAFYPDRNLDCETY